MKLFKEISQIVFAIIFLTGGLALILTYLDGKLLIGVIMMAIGILIFILFAKGAVIKWE